MKLTLNALQQYPLIQQLLIHSLEGGLYQASVRLGNQQHYIYNDQGQLLVTRSLLAMQQLFQHLPIVQQTLRQTSAYDEMVGGPVKVNNTLDIPLYDQQLY